VVLVALAVVAARVAAPAQEGSRPLLGCSHLQRRALGHTACPRSRQRLQAQSLTGVRGNDTARATTLHVVRVRDDNPDQPPLLVVEDAT
jgi:hypothetical protein